MAIRPVDLQLAYLAAPQNAAVADSAQNAPQISQQAAQTAFTAQLAQREESIEQSTHVEGNAVHARGDGEQGSEHSQRDGDGDAQREETKGLGFAGGGEHFIDVTA